MGEHKDSTFKALKILNSNLFQIGHTMGLRQGVGLLALLAVLTKGEDYGYSSRSEPNT